MDGENFAYEGRSGPWACTIYLLKTSDGNFAATGDIAFRGQHRCKLVLCRPLISVETGIGILKRQCIAWIEQAELDAEAAALSS
ncbi:hypothetical protein [Variovorax sp. W6]|uniref:hypothetical protein n=1 Tax=Variovorax sp. W6 TaxID=3093895 RepID=UPI003D807315